MPSTFVFLLLIGSCSAIRLREKHATEPVIEEAKEQVPWQRFCKYDGYGEQNLEDCSTWHRQGVGCTGECMALRDCPYPDPAKPWLHHMNNLFIHPPGSNPDRSCGHLFCCDDASEGGWNGCPGTCVEEDDGNYEGCDIEFVQKTGSGMDRACPRGKSCCAQKLRERVHTPKVLTHCKSLAKVFDQGCADNNLDPEGCYQSPGCKWDNFHGVCETDCSGFFKDAWESKTDEFLSKEQLCNSVPQCRYGFTAGYHACHELRARYRRARNCHSDEFWDESAHTCRPRCDELSEELCTTSEYYNKKCYWDAEHESESVKLKIKVYENATRDAPSLLQNLETFKAKTTQ